MWLPTRKPSQRKMQRGYTRVRHTLYPASIVSPSGGSLPLRQEFPSLEGGVFGQVLPASLSPVIRPCASQVYAMTYPAKKNNPIYLDARRNKPVQVISKVGRCLTRSIGEAWISRWCHAALARSVSGKVHREVFSATRGGAHVKPR